MEIGDPGARLFKLDETTKALTGQYTVDRTALEKTLREARARHGRNPRKGGQWQEAERALDAGMKLELREDGTFSMTRSVATVNLKGTRAGVGAKGERSDPMVPPEWTHFPVTTP